MPVSQVDAFKSSDGRFHNSEGDAQEAEGRIQLDRWLERHGVTRPIRDELKTTVRGRAMSDLRNALNVVFGPPEDLRGRIVMPDTGALVDGPSGPMLVRPAGFEDHPAP